MKAKSIFCVVIFSVIFYSNLYGQCQIAEIAPFGRLFAAGGRIGQTFTACNDGAVTNIEVYLTSLGEHYLWLGEPNGGLLNELYLTFEVTERGLQQLTLEQGFIVRKNQSYEFQIQVDPASITGNLTGG